MLYRKKITIKIISQMTSIVIIMTYVSQTSVTFNFFAYFHQLGENQVEGSIGEP